MSRRPTRAAFPPPRLASGSADEERALTRAWATHMRRGDFPRAWRISEDLLRARAAQSSADRPPEERWIWNGAPLLGRRVLVRCFRGLGDTIQFVRYLPLLKAIARETTVAAPAQLLSLLARAAGIDRVILENYAPCLEFGHDAEVEVMELPFVFQTTVETIPTGVPYLHVEPMCLNPDETFKVGIVWRSGKWDTRRSIPFTLMERLQDVPAVTWYILQRGPGLEEWGGGIGVLSPADTILDQARVMRSLDVVISVDSMPAHLAGALGVRTWILLHAESDWRWLDHREDSPWYPTATLFRQERAGEWAPVVARVQRALEHIAAKRCAAGT